MRFLNESRFSPESPFCPHFFAVTSSKNSFKKWFV